MSSTGSYVGALPCAGPEPEEPVTGNNIYISEGVVFTIEGIKHTYTTIKDITDDLNITSLVVNATGIYLNNNKLC
jgi:hypothetical protein